MLARSDCGGGGTPPLNREERILKRIASVIAPHLSASEKLRIVAEVETGGNPYLSSFDGTHEVYTRLGSTTLG